MNTISMSDRARLLIEVAVFIALALAGKAVLSLVAWQYAGPVSLILLLVVLTVYLQRQGLSWRDFGLIRLPTLRDRLMILPKTLLTFLAIILGMGLLLGGSALLQIEFMSEVPDSVDDRWGAVEGNLPLFLMWLGIVWTAAAFGEEMFFRGYLVTRLEQAFSGSWVASVLAVLLAAILFGYGHYYYQGLRGAITTGTVAIIFGTMFLVFKKNLWPVILVHGLIDTLTFTALYAGWE